MKKMIKQIVCAALVPVVAVGMSFAAFAGEDGVTEETFSYVQSFTNETVSSKYYYSDSFFSDPSTKRSTELTTMSMVLSFSMMGLQDTVSAEKLLADIGFSDVRTDDLDKTPTCDTIGSLIARKKVGDKTIVAVGVRGGSYEAEWASNFIGGASGNAEGFDKAANIVTARLKEYISERSLENVQLWITGYSRGGAVADLMGVYINEHTDEFPTTADDVFVYTYETPACCASSKIYDNIYCIRNRNDVVTYVYPRSWELYTNGTELLIGEDKTINTSKIDLLASEHVVMVGQEPMDEFLAKLVDFTFGEMGRETYSGDFDDSLASLAQLYFSKPETEWQPTIDFVKNELLSRGMTNDRFKYVLMYEGLGGVMLHNSDKMYAQFTDELILALGEITTPQELGLTEQEYKVICDNLYPLLRALGPVIVRDYNYKEGAENTTIAPNYDDPDYDPQKAFPPTLTYDQYVAATKAVSSSGQTADNAKNTNALSQQSADLPLYHFSTFFVNLNDIIINHYPQTTWEYVKALDPYYAQSGEKEPAPSDDTETRSDAQADVDTDPTSDISTDTDSESDADINADTDSDTDTAAASSEKDSTSSNSTSSKENTSSSSAVSSQTAKSEPASQTNRTSPLTATIGDSADTTFNNVAAACAAFVILVFVLAVVLCGKRKSES